MAIDSEKKRKSIAAIGHLPIGVVLVPDGSIDAGDRAAAGGTYAGIALDAPATIFYVDYTVPNDTGDGSIGDPFKYINTHVNAMAAGDIMYLRGDVNPGTPQGHTGTATIAPTVSGSDGSPITITNYPGEYVTLAPPTSGTDIFDFATGTDYWTVSGTGPAKHIEIDCDDLAAYPIDIHGDNIKFEYCEIHNGGFAGIFRVNGADDCVISNCDVYDNYRGVSLDAHGILVNAGSARTIIEYCYIYDCAGAQIIISGTSENDGIIRYNELEAGVSRAAAASENGINNKTGTGWLIHNNEIHGFRDCDGSQGGTGGNGEAILMAGGSGESNDIYDNTIHNCSGEAIRTDLAETRIWGNLIHSMAAEAAATEIIFNFSTTGTVTVYNNTIDGRYGVNDGDLFRLAGQVHVNLYNNLFNDTSPALLNLSLGSINYNNNGWFGTATRHYSGTFDVVHLDPGGDPKFWDEAGDDYRLKASSKAVNAGTIQDPFTNDRVGTPDIGYYEVLPVQPLIGEIGIEHVIFGKRVIK